MRPTAKLRYAGQQSHAGQSQHERYHGGRLPEQERYGIANDQYQRESPDVE